MSEELNERWALALHESSHGVATIVLGGQCSGVAMHNGAGGAAMEGLTPRRHAIATAAGPAGEKLADRFPVPTAPPAADRPLTLDEFLAHPDDVRTLIISNQARSDEDRFLISDDRVIALWAVTANEKWPETWAERVADVHRAAAELVEEHADRIARLASALYVSGSLNEEQIAECLDGGST